MFIYTISRDQYTVVGGIIFTLSILITTVDPKPLSSSLTAKEFNYDSKADKRNYTVALNQNLVKIHNSDHTLLRLVVVFVGIVLVFALLICLCVMYWCVCCAVQWTRMLPTSTHTRPRSRAIRKLVAKESPSDLPPAYEVILATQEDEAETRATARNIDTEEEPPSYIEVLNNNMGIILIALNVHQVKKKQVDIGVTAS